MPPKARKTAAKKAMTPAQKAALDRGRAKRHETYKKRATQPPRKSRHQQLLDGELTVDDMDDEELQHFRGRDVDGEFKGRSVNLPKKLHDAIRQRLLRQMQQGFEGFLPKAQAILEDIAAHGENESARVKATDLLLQRGAGKVPDRVIVTETTAWDEAMQAMLEEADDDSAQKARDALKRMNADG